MKKADTPTSELSLVPVILDDCPRLPGMTDRSLRDQRILDHLSVVRTIAIQVHRSIPVHVDLDDLVHAGVMGLIDAASKFNPEKEVAFHSYAKHRIRGSILDSLRKEDWALRETRKRHKQLEAIHNEFSANLIRSPTEQEIAGRTRASVECWRKIALELRMVGLVSASSRMPDEENQSTPEFPAPPNTRPDTMVGLGQLNTTSGSNRHSP